MSFSRPPAVESGKVPIGRSGFSRRLDDQSVTVIGIGSVNAPHAGNAKLTWTLEVWGRVRWWPVFYYPFRIEVLPADLTGT